MDIETLEEIKRAAAEALRGKKQLKKIHASYVTATNAGHMTRARTTTYNARTADIVNNRVKPNVALIKELSST